MDVPLLRKDFTLDEYQIWEARAHGADLILLIVAALSDQQLREFSALSRELGMNVLVETHTPEEIERAVAADARIIGVNVRNLKTLDVDRSLFASLAGSIPAGAWWWRSRAFGTPTTSRTTRRTGPTPSSWGRRSSATPPRVNASRSSRRPGPRPSPPGPELPPNRGAIRPHAVRADGA